jgi:hypothetical protein
MLPDSLPTISLTLPLREQRAQTCGHVQPLPHSQSSLSWHHISSYDSREHMDHVLTLPDRVRSDAPLMPLGRWRPALWNLPRAPSPLLVAG